MVIIGTRYLGMLVAVMLSIAMAYAAEGGEKGVNLGIIISNKSKESYQFLLLGENHELRRFVLLAGEISGYYEEGLKAEERFKLDGTKFTFSKNFMITVDLARRSIKYTTAAWGEAVAMFDGEGVIEIGNSPIGITRHESGAFVAIFFSDTQNPDFKSNEAIVGLLKNAEAEVDRMLKQGTISISREFFTRRSRASADDHSEGGLPLP